VLTITRKSGPLCVHFSGMQFPGYGVARWEQRAASNLFALSNVPCRPL
jgi:hypothetical protein